MRRKERERGGKGSSKGSEAGGSLENLVKSRGSHSFTTKRVEEAGRNRGRAGRGRAVLGKSNNQLSEGRSAHMPECKHPHTY